MPPDPCANFTSVSPDASPSPTPSADQSPSPSASPDETPSFIATPARVSTTLSGFDVISKPPFVFLPIFGIGGILLALAYWIVVSVRHPRRAAALPAAAVVHRASRPDYSAGFGAPPQPHAPGPQASAWNEPMHTAQAPPAATPFTPMATPSPSPATPPEPQRAPEPQAEWGPPVEWGTGSSDWGFPEPSGDDFPEVPQPGD